MWGSEVWRGPRGTGSNPWSYLIMEQAIENSHLPTGAGSRLASTVIPSNGNSWAEEMEKHDCASNNNERFFIIKPTQGSFEKISPFLIQKTVNSMVGNVKNIKKLRSGDLLIEVANSSQAKNIKKLSHFQNIPVSVSPHTTLNFSRGVISEFDLLHTSEEEIVENLKGQNVCAARRITIRRNETTFPTKHIILTFQTPTLPKYITAGYLNCSVRPYIPNPLRCFKCQRFGHSQTACRGSLTCARCSTVGHESEGCSGIAKCINCQGDHPAYSRSCPKWIAEKEIQTLRVTQNISYIEARKQLYSRTPKVGVSYADMTAFRKPTKSIATQTENPIFYARTQSNTHTVQETNILTQKSVTNPLPPRDSPPESHSPHINTKKPNKKNKSNTSTSRNNKTIPASNLATTKSSSVKRSAASKSAKHLIKEAFPRNPASEQKQQYYETEDAIKGYVSPGEEMSTDGSETDHSSIFI